MADVSGFVAKAAEKCGFVRERFNEADLPTDVDNIAVVPFFGDLRSLFVLSSLLLKRLCTEDKGSKYVILCSWSGYEHLFPYVDEYWGVADESVARILYADACQFRNKSELAHSYYRNLNQFFFEDMVLPHEYFKPYYNEGITNEFWTKYKHVKKTLPSVPSAFNLGREFTRDLNNRGGFKVFVYPSIYTSQWRGNDIVQQATAKEFWLSLVERLIKEKFVPVICKTYLTHDLSEDFTDRCLYVSSNDVAYILSAMRATGCVLDLFNGVSRLALAARCPFLSVDMRARYSALKEYEIDDLCGKTLPKQYIFTFPTIIDGSGPDRWDFSILNNIIVRLNKFLPELDRDEWPSAGEVSSEIVSYDEVRKKKLKKIGIKLLKLPKD